MGIFNGEKNKELIDYIRQLYERVKKLYSESSGDDVVDGSFDRVRSSSASGKKRARRGVEFIHVKGVHAVTSTIFVPY